MPFLTEYSYPVHQNTSIRHKFPRHAECFIFLLCISLIHRNTVPYMREVVILVHSISTCSNLNAEKYEASVDCVMQMRLYFFYVIFSFFIGLCTHSYLIPIVLIRFSNKIYVCRLLTFVYCAVLSKMKSCNEMNKYDNDEC